MRRAAAADHCVRETPPASGVALLLLLLPHGRGAASEKVIYLCTVTCEVLLLLRRETLAAARCVRTRSLPMAL